MNPKQSYLNLEEQLKEWYASHTFHYKQFSDVKELVRLKQKQDITISCGIPTFNEEKTIGKIVKTLWENLVKKYPLIDELAVIDSNSTDNTREEALRYNADVYLADQYLRNYGIHKGKGENLWKSLYLLKGDIIVWIDADIKNIHPRFVYGLIGPLLKNKELGYVKAFYKRPLNIGKFHSKNDGGRVTECTVRPIFNLFFPELSYIVQPCSGEYAGRRELLEQLEFPVGYYVEASHLIQIVKNFGLDVLTQVNLEERVHRNKKTIELGKMSFGILHGIFNTLRERGYNIKELNSLYRLPVVDIDPPGFKKVEIDSTIRPPMETIKEYQEKHYSIIKKPIIEPKQEIISFELYAISKA